MGRVNYSGLVVAGIGFFLTRFTVTLALYEDPVQFYLAGVVPLVLGLGLSAFGMALAVGDIDRSLVRTMASWSVAGAVATLVLVALTLVGSSPDGMPALSSVRSQTYLSNFLIGGSVGGTLTGLYAARNRRQRRQLRNHTTRLEVLNGLLRHEVLNALTAIRGYASVEAGGNRESQRVIENRSDAIEETIEEVRYLTESAGMDGATVGPVDVGTHVEESVRTVRNRHPDASVRATLTGQDPTVLANSRLGYVFTHLVENAVVHTDGRATVDVSVATTNGDVRVRVSDDGPGLPESERRFLETGDLNSFENPGSGFGLYFVRFLVESYGGSIETDVGPGGTTVTVVLTQVDESGPGPRTSSASGVRPSVSHLAVVVAAALAAGVGFGLASGLLGESVGIIGVLYGVQNVLVGWITHQFHSIVFGFVFAGLVTLAPRRYHDHVPAYVAIGTGFGVSLWFVAAGVVSPVWLQLLGIPAPLPNLTAVSLVAHLVWGATLGTLTALGYRYVVPRFERRGDRLRGG